MKLLIVILLIPILYMSSEGGPEALADAPCVIF